MHLFSFFFLFLLLSFLPKALAESSNFELSRYANESSGVWRWEEEGQCWFRLVDGRGMCESDQVTRDKRQVSDSLSELRDRLRAMLLDLGIDVSGFDLSRLSKYRLRSLINDLPELSIDEVQARLSSASRSTSSRVQEILDRGDRDGLSYQRSDRIQEILDRDGPDEDPELGSRAREILNRNGGGFFSSDNSPPMHPIFYKPLGLFTCQNIYDEREGEIFGPVPCTSYPGVFTEN